MIGPGMMIWKEKNCDNGDLNKTIQRMKAMGMTSVALKIGDAASTTYQSYKDMRRAVSNFKAAGFTVWAWHYVYGGVWVKSGVPQASGMPTPAQEAAFAVKQVKEYGFDGYVIDAEREYKVLDQFRRAREFAAALKGKLTVPVGLCSYRFPLYHQEFPFKEFLTVCTHHMPQVYWGSAKDAPKNELINSHKQLKALKDIPFIPVGREYIGDGDALPTGDEAIQFMDTARSLGMEACSFWAYDFICQHKTGKEIEEKLQKYIWATVKPPEQGEVSMAKAKGLSLKGSQSAIGQLSGYDFLVASSGEQFHKNVQAAADAKIPCILMHENNPESLVEFGFNPSKWTDDKNPDLIKIKDAVGSRAVHGIMIDDSKNVDSAGKIIDVNWLVSTARHLIERVWAIYKKQVFLYMGYTVPLVYDGNGKETIYSFIASQGNISSYSAATLDASGYPTGRPQLPYDDAEKAPCNFWFYSKGGKVEVVYKSTKEDLYSLLGFTASGTTPGGTTDPVTPPVTDPVINGSTKGIEDRLDIIINLLKNGSKFS